MLGQNSHRAKVIVGVIVCCMFSTLSLLAIINRQLIVDQFVVWRFKTTPEVIGLVERAGMNEYGKFLYLASEPQLVSTQKFNDDCQRTESVISILGCFKDGRIYLYDVTDETLDGIREVTATHEALHAVYARMGDGEKAKIDALIEVTYKNLKNIAQYSEIMEFYAKSEPGQRDNELHSIIGTEIKDINPELEVHYSKYFHDRQKVVVLNAKYKGVFAVLNDKAKSLMSQMSDISSHMVSRVDKYNSDTLVLNQDIAAFNSKTNSGGFTTEYQFTAARNLLVKRIDDLEGVRVAIQNDIATYNRLIKEYNAIETESKKLSNSIDSTLAPAPSV